MFDLAVTLPAVAASAACAAAYSTSDFFKKSVPGAVVPALALFYAFSLESLVLVLWLLLSGDTRFDAGYIVPGAAVAVIGLAANILYLIALRRSPISLMVPLLALVPVFTAVAGGVLLGEWPTAQQGLGIIAVAAGLFLLYVPSTGGFHPVLVWRSFAGLAGTKPMIGVVLLWSISPPVDKLCLAHAGVGLHGLIQLIILSSATGLWVLIKGGPRAFALPKGAAKPLFGVAATAGLGYGLQLAAYQMTLVAMVELIKRVVGLIGALIFGRAYFQEPITGPKLTGMAVIALGLPLVLLG